MQMRKTCKRWNFSGHAHLLTFSCFKRRPFLSKDRSRQWLIDGLAYASQKHNFEIWAYVVMPEHAHVMVYSVSPIYSVSKFLSSVKIHVSRKALSFVRAEAPEFLEKMADTQPDGSVHYRFWQRGGGYDQNLVKPNTVLNAINYIHENPIRRGLCKRAEEWHWSSVCDPAHLVNTTSLHATGT